MSKNHVIFVISESNGKSYWNRAGVAYENRDGSFTFKLDILPDTKFQLREQAPKSSEDTREAAQ